MTAHDHEPTTGPYAHAAALYWNAGWRGVLPLPPRAKKSPPTGWTGRTQDWPTYPDVYAWTEDHPDGNLALRLPHHVIGVDVDDYEGKNGGTTLTALQAAFGPLPPTWRTTSRDDGISGICLYRVTEGAAWPGDLGPGIEIIQWCHRYAVAWPSIHPEGRTYRWVNPQGLDAVGVLPTPDDLPTLPARWVQGLTHGRSDVATIKTALPAGAASTWLEQLRDRHPCRETTRALARYTTDLAPADGNPGRSRHEVALTATMRLIRLAAEGHDGVPSALLAFKKAWAHALAGSRSADEENGEWARLLEGAIAAVHTNPPAATDPCANPFAGILQEGSWPNLPTPTIPQALATATGPGGPSTGTGGVTASTPTPAPGKADGSPAPPSGTYGSTSPAGAGAPADAATPSNPTTHPTGSETPAEPRTEAARTTWWPRDLEDVLAGTLTEPGPTHLTRTDGQALFYSGKTNGIIGESESGKTFVALLAVTQALAEQVPVTYVDFEDTAPGLVTRLRDVGAHDDHLRTLFSYIGPDTSLDALASGDLHEHLAATTPGLVVLDGVNAAMTLLGLDLNSNTDATVFAQRLLRPLADTGACLVYVDHIPKAAGGPAGVDTKGGIGAQAKRAMTTGCTLRADVVKPFGRGQTGRLKLTIDKDRPGHVRGAAHGARQAGTAVLVSDATTGHISICVEPPENATVNSDGERQPFRPTHLMEKVSAFLATIPGGASGKAVETEVYGNANAIRTALGRLVEEGYARREHGPRSSLLHYHVKPYTQAGDLVSEPPRPTSSDLVPTSSGRGGQSPTTTSSSSSPPEGDEDEVRQARVGKTMYDLVYGDGDEVEPVACHGCGEVTNREQLYAGLCRRCRRV